LGEFLQKNHFLLHFFAKKFAGFGKTAYLCTRKSEMTRNLLQ
jgi:hypothetical protein